MNTGRLPVREQAWLNCCLKFFDQIPDYRKASFLLSLPIPSNVALSEELFKQACLKLVEIEALDLEKDLKHLDPLTPEERISLFQGPMLWGSLLEVLKEPEVGIHLDSAEAERPEYSPRFTITDLLNRIQEFKADGLLPKIAYISKERMLDLMQDVLIELKAAGAQAQSDFAKIQNAFQDRTLEQLNRVELSIGGCGVHICDSHQPYSQIHFVCVRV